MNSCNFSEVDLPDLLSHDVDVDHELPVVPDCVVQSDLLVGQDVQYV